MKRHFLPSENVSSSLFLCPCHSGPHIKPYSMDPSIPFPLAYPTMDNILAICQYSNLRPRYTKDMLPKSGFDHLRRQARAVNQLESWFTLCCSNGTQDEELTLCCAKQAVRIQADCLHIIPHNSVFNSFPFSHPMCTGCDCVRPQMSNQDCLMHWLSTLRPWFTKCLCIKKHVYTNAHKTTCKPIY